MLSLGLEMQNQTLLLSFRPLLRSESHSTVVGCDSPANSSWIDRISAKLAAKLPTPKYVYIAKNSNLPFRIAQDENYYPLSSSRAHHIDTYPGVPDKIERMTNPASNHLPE
jgi:hypothetical protein